MTLITVALPNISLASIKLKEGEWVENVMYPLSKVPEATDLEVEYLDENSMIVQTCGFNLHRRCGIFSSAVEGYIVPWTRIISWRPYDPNTRKEE